MKSVDAVFAATLVALGAFSLLVLHRIIRDWPPRARKFAPLLFVLPALILTGAFQGYLSLKSIAYPVERIWIVRTPEPGFLIETKRQSGSRRVPVRETEFILLNDQGQLIERYLHISESELMKRYSAVRIDGACRPDQDFAVLAGLSQVHSSRLGCAGTNTIIAATGFAPAPSLLDRLMRRTYLRIILIDQGRAKWSKDLAAPPL